MSQTPPAIPPSAMIPPSATEPPPPPPPYMPDGQKKAVGIAIAALILGICGFIPVLGLLCGLVGVILGIVALAQNTSRKGFAIAGIVTGGTGMLVMPLLISILLPTLGRAKELAKQALCQANLKGIGSSIIIYSSENDDAYPPNLEMMIGKTEMSEKLLKCPSAESNRGCDYFYAPPAQKTIHIEYPPTTIIVCDFKDNHGGKGRNVLYTDGHVQWLSEEEFQAKLQQSHNTAFAKALRKAEGP